MALPPLTDNVYTEMVHAAASCAGTGDRMRAEHASVCPLDCPDTCSLTVTVEDERIVAIRGSRANPYTAGGLCAKVPGAYPGFVHGQGRLTTPPRPVGAKGEGRLRRISWPPALDILHARFAAL